jgi:predicted transcriptional regulator YdeE
VFKAVPPQRVVGVRDLIPGYHDVGRLFEELRAFLRVQRVVLDDTCPGIAIYYDAEYRDRGIDVEAAVPIPRSLSGTSRVVVHELPGIETVACVAHRGGYDGLPEAYNALMTWTEANGYQIVGPNRNVYLQGPDPSLDPASYVTEVQFPVERKPIFSLMQKEKSDMEPKIVTKPAFTVVGMLYHGKNENNEIAQMWRQFNPRIKEIEHMGLQDAYGVCGAAEEDGAFKYVAGLEVSNLGDLPTGMVSWEVPEQTYVVLPCTLKTIGEAYQYAFKTWIPQSGYQAGDGPDFELYDESFHPDEEGSVLYVYVPIKKS